MLSYSWYCVVSLVEPRSGCETIVLRLHRPLETIVSAPSVSINQNILVVWDCTTLVNIGRLNRHRTLQNYNNSHESEICHACVPPGFYIYSPRLIYWLLIMATAPMIMCAPCASGSTWKCLSSCQVLPCGNMRQTTWLSKRQANETSLQWDRSFEGWACYNAVTYWLQTKQTNKSKH